MLQACSNSCLVCQPGADVCKPNPCRNRGLCVYGNNNTTYTCNCTGNFTGTNCTESTLTTTTQSTTTATVRVCANLNDRFCNQYRSDCGTRKTVNSMLFRYVCPVACGLCIPTTTASTTTTITSTSTTSRIAN